MIDQVVVSLCGVARSFRPRFVGALREALTENPNLLRDVAARLKR